MENKMMSVNSILNEAAEKINEFDSLDESNKKIVKEKIAEIKNARRDEDEAIKSLKKLKIVNKIPTVELIDGTKSNDYDIVKSDINMRTKMNINKLAIEIKKIFPIWTESWTDTTVNNQIK